MFVFFSSRRRHTSCALVTGVQTCALPISCLPPSRHIQDLFNARTLGTQTVMKKLLVPLSALSVLALGATSLPVHVYAENGGEQGEARKERKAGNILSIREIEHIVLPRMTGKQYLGPD